MEVELLTGFGVCITVLDVGSRRQHWIEELPEQTPLNEIPPQLETDLQTPRLLPTVQHELPDGGEATEEEAGKFVGNGVGKGVMEHAGASAKQR